MLCLHSVAVEWASTHVYKIITIFTGIVKRNQEFGFRIEDCGFKKNSKAEDRGQQAAENSAIRDPKSALPNLQSTIFNLLHDRVYDQGQASVDESGSLLCVRGDGCGRWRAAFPGTRDCDGHRHADASAHAQ